MEKLLFFARKLEMKTGCISWSRNSLENSKKSIIALRINLPFLRQGLFLEMNVGLKKMVHVNIFPMIDHFEISKWKNSIYMIKWQTLNVIFHSDILMGPNFCQ